MADGPTYKPSDFNELTGSVDNFNESIGDGLKGINKLSRSLDSMLGDSEKGFRKITESIRRVSKAIRPSIKDFDKFTEVADNAEKGIKKIATGYANAFYGGNKAGMSAMTVIAKNGEAMASLGRQIKITSEQLNVQSANFKDTVDRIANTKDEINKLVKQQEKYNTIIKKGGEGAKGAKEDLEQVTNQIKLHTDAIAAANVLAITQMESSYTLTNAYKKQRDGIIALNKEMISSAEAERASNRELRILNGGLDAFRASAEGVVDSKVFEYIKKAGTFALVIGGWHMLSKALSQTQDHMRAVSRISLSLGDTSQVGFGRLWDSAKEAGKEVSTLKDLSADLGYTGEELADTMNKVRASIRMDKDGRFSSEKIRDLTTEIAYFARVSNMELGDATALMENRIKRYGMSSAQAIASMQEMRTTLLHMTGSTKNALIPMGEMVNIIEEASAASQSYVVDTRTMTQAIRGAVNQAEHLGVAQKQAQDVAKGVGKVLSSAPDFIKIPAGFTLVDQLLGKDADKLLRKLDKGTRKQVKEIQEDLRSGKLDYYVGAKALMDLIGQTDAGLEAQSKQLEQTLLQGPAAAELIAEQYGIENRATARMVTKMMQEAMEMKAKIGGDMGFSTMMVKDTALMAASIDEVRKKNKGLTEEEIKNATVLDMMQKGLSKSQAEEYYDNYMNTEKMLQGKRQALGKLKKDGELKNAAEIARLEQEIFEATTKQQTLKLNEFLRPTQKILSDIENAKLELKTGEAGELYLNADALKAAGIKNSNDLAKKLGITYKTATTEQKQKLDALIKKAEEGNLNQDELADTMDGMHNELSVANKAATDAAKDPYGKSLVDWANKLYAKLGIFGPILMGMTGLGGIIAGLYLFYKGQKANSLMVANMMDGKIYRNVFRALKEAPSRERGSGPDHGQDLLPEGKGKWGDRLKKASGKVKGKAKAFSKTKGGKAAIIATAIATAAGLYYMFKPDKKKEGEELPEEVGGEEGAKLSGAGAAATAAIVKKEVKKEIVKKEVKKEVAKEEPKKKSKIYQMGEEIPTRRLTPEETAQRSDRFDIRVQQDDNDKAKYNQEDPEMMKERQETLDKMYKDYEEKWGKEAAEKLKGSEKERPTRFYKTTEEENKEGSGEGSSPLMGENKEGSGEGSSPLMEENKEGSGEGSSPLMDLVKSEAPSLAMKGAKSLAAKVAAKPSLLVKGAEAGLKVAKGAAKIAKAIPFLGNVVAAGFAVKQAWELYDKWKEDPNSITASDKIKMAAALAGMIPGIGNAIMIADTAADLTGGYDLLDEVTKQKEGVQQDETAGLAFDQPPDIKMGQFAESGAGSITGKPSLMPEPLAPPASPRRQFASVGGPTGASSLDSNLSPGSLTPDGALTLKVKGIYDIFSQYMKERSASS